MGEKKKNVPVIFAYSLVAGLLSGNINLVRVSSKPFPQVDIICDSINKLLKTHKFPFLESKLFIFTYDKRSNLTDYFSSIADVRILWGGDKTISELKKSETPIKCYDISFVDKYSMCIINADVYLCEENKTRIARNFYNDTYFYDQNACTSPHLVIWMGTNDNIAKAKKDFWNNLYVHVKQEYSIMAITAVDKYVSLCELALTHDIGAVINHDNLIVRISINHLFPGIEKLKFHSGYFFEYEAKSINELATIINRKFQTIAYYGFSKNELKAFIIENKPNGIDRIVPLGQTADFSLYWDGFDLLNSLTRTIHFGK